MLVEMTNYCEALREIVAAGEEIPGHRGYPGYMYTDFASRHERAGRIRGRPGSVTQLPILSMPDDVRHPIPDLTGYITAGQIVLSRELDHRGVAAQLYAFLARGRELRRLVSIVGKQSLSADDRDTRSLAEEFERRVVGQGSERRSVEETLDLAWELLGRFPASELERIRPELIERYAPREAT